MNRDGRSSAAASAKDAAGWATDKAQDAAAGAERHRAAGWVTGAGQIANGIVHFAIGAIALGVVLSPWFYAPTEGPKRLLWFAGTTLLAGALAVRALITG